MSGSALALSGGGLFGAWQVGVWSVLEKQWKPDLVVGCSIGSLNGWAIAGGASAAELAEWWERAAADGRLRWRWPRRPLDGIVDPTQLETWIRDLHASFRPAIEYHVVLTDLLRLQPTIASGSAVTWRHLAASCAVLGLLPQQKLDGRTYTDGGLLGALPLWAVRQRRAAYCIGLNVMPRMPWPIRAALRPLRKMKGMSAKQNLEGMVLAPSQPLGSWKQALWFERATIREWIDMGRRDAEAALREKTFPPENVLRHNRGSGSVHA